MGCVDMVLVVQWLKLLRLMAMNFKEIFMRFLFKGKKIEHKGMQGKAYKVISSKNINILFKSGHLGVISQLCLIYSNISLVG